jgi:hypothetical protein
LLRHHAAAAKIWRGSSVKHFALQANRFVRLYVFGGDAFAPNL